MRDDIEPRLSFVECRGIPLSNDGSGVVVIGVPASKLGPHWVASTREAAIRRGAHSISMTMSEIQDLTLKLSRDADAIEREFDRRAGLFSARFDRDSPRLEAQLLQRVKGFGKQAHAMGVGLVAMPLAPFGLRDVVTDKSVQPGPQLADGIVRVDGQQVVAPSFFSRRSMAPRSARIRAETAGGEHWREVTDRGTIDVATIDVEDCDPDGPCLFALELMAWSSMFVLLWIERLRTKAEMPDAPFAVSFFLRCSYGRVVPATARRQYASGDNAFPSDTRSPSYRVGVAESFEPLLREIARSRSPR
jgi:hypothetical protein